MYKGRRGFGVKILEKFKENVEKNERKWNNRSNKYKGSSRKVKSDETLMYYDANAKAFTEGTVNVDLFCSYRTNHSVGCTEPRTR